MNAGQAGQLVAKFIGRNWPNDREEIFEILQLGINKAWGEGKWFGMTVEGYVGLTYSSNGKYIVGPASHPILLAINIHGIPQDIRSHHFKFHRNGDGQIMDCNGCKWNTAVYDSGEFPYLEGKININDGVFIGVRSLGVPGPDEKVWIKGSHVDGNQVFTYKNSEDKLDTCGCIVDTTKIDIINGLELDVTSDFRYIKNIRLHDIKAITKTKTRNPVEILAFDCDGNTQLLARLEPGDTESKYRRYYLPDDLCKYSSVHGLFKVAEQPNIVSDSDTLLIRHREALISLCMAINYIFYKSQQDLGAQYFLNAITALEKQKREHESPDIFPVQVDFPGGSEQDPIFHTA